MRALLLCHGKAYGSEAPHFYEDARLDMASSVTVDVNPFAIPEICLDLEKEGRKLTKLVGTSKFDLVLPMYCVSDVYGSLDRPNMDLFTAVSDILTPRGRMVVSLPMNSLYPERFEKRSWLKIQDTIDREFISKLPPSLRKVAKRHNVWPIIQPIVFDHDRKIAAASREAIVGRYPEMVPAIEWLEETAAKWRGARKDTFGDELQRIDKFGSEVVRLSNGKLKRLQGTNKRVLVFGKGKGVR